MVIAIGNHRQLAKPLKPFPHPFPPLEEANAGNKARRLFAIDLNALVRFSHVAFNNE